MPLKKEYEDAYKVFIILGICILIANIYYYAFPLWNSFGLSHPVATKIFLSFRKAGAFASPYKTKTLALLFSCLTVLTRHGRRKDAPWSVIAGTGVAGAILFFFPWKTPVVYTLTAVTGYALTVTSLALLIQKFHRFEKMTDDARETFEQCKDIIENENSINLPITYQYQGKKCKGWINVTSPFAGTIVTGVPGTGKSYSVFLPFAEQMIKKGYTMFLYDFKYPVLTYDIYNMLLQNQDAYRKRGLKVPKFYAVNFNDPRFSHRCNPLSRRYLRSLTDCTDVASVLMDNLAKVDKEDFFSQSARLYTDCCISFLWLYDGGRYCSFPHLVELMSQPAEVVTEMLSLYRELRTKVASFKEALNKNASEQIAGQVASATVPIAGLSTPELFWALSGEDFTLDISNPDDPKVVCVGNDPDKKDVYGAALSLFFACMFKAVNHPGNLPSAIMFDEAPTVKIKALDYVVSTARSNKVAVVIGGQDLSQFVRDYQKDNAEVIFNTVGNVFSGRVNGRTAKDYSEMFGKRFREHRGRTLGEDSESVNISYSQDDIMPRSKIETLSTGTFFGKVCDTFEDKNDLKFFCGEIGVDRDAVKERKARSVDIPQLTSFNEEIIRQAVVKGDVPPPDLIEKQIAPDIHTQGLESLGRVVEKKANRNTTDPAILLEAAERVPEDKRRDFLEGYADMYIEEYVQDRLRENHMRIQDEVDDILRKHGLDEESRKAREEEKRKSRKGGNKEVEDLRRQVEELSMRNENLMQMNQNLEKEKRDMERRRQELDNLEQRTFDRTRSEWMANNGNEAINEYEGS